MKHLNGRKNPFAPTACLHQMNKPVPTRMKAFFISFAIRQRNGKKTLTEFQPKGNVFLVLAKKKRLHARKQGTTKGGENKDHQIDENERTMIKHNNNKHLHTLKTKSTYVLCSNQSHHHHHQEASHLQLQLLGPTPTPSSRILVSLSVSVCVSISLLEQLTLSGRGNETYE